VSTGGASVYERTDALPRIRWAGTGVVEPDGATRLAMLAEGVDPDTVVLGADTGWVGNGADAEVEVVSDEPEEIVARVDADGAGWLVVADALQHGWVAELDGEEVPLVDADHAVVAVEVPEGEHEVVLRYTGEGRSTGITLTVVAGLVLLAIAVAGALTRRRRSTTRTDAQSQP
jgi:hypothetical protein